MSVDYFRIYETLLTSSAVLSSLITVSTGAVMQNSLVRWDGSTAELIQGSGVILDDNDNMTIPTGSTITFNGTGSITFTEVNNTGRWVSLEGPASIDNSYVLSLPAGTGAPGQTLGISTISGNTYSLNWVENSGGAVVGIASSTENAIVRWDGTTAINTQDSSVIINGSNNLLVPTGSNVTFNGTGGGLVFTEDSGGDTVTIKGPGSLAVSWGLTVPASAGTSDYLLSVEALVGDDTELTWAPHPGLTGPSSSVDNAIVRWNGVNSDRIASSNVIIDDDDDLHIPTGSHLILNGTGGGIVFTEDAGANTATLKGPGSVASSYSIVFPSAIGSTDDTLRIDSVNTNQMILTWSPDQGVSGPASSTDNAIARWTGTNGSSIHNSTVTITDANNLVMNTGTNIVFNGISYIVFKEAGGSNTASVRAPNSITADYTISFPTAGASINNTLRIDSVDGTNALMTWSPDQGVTGPSSSTNNAIARWNGTDGAVLQNSGVIMDDSDNITIPAGFDLKFDGINGGFVFTESAGANTATIKGPTTIDSDVGFILPNTVGTPQDYILKIASTNGTDMILDWVLDYGVTGPASSTDNAIARWDGTSGDTLQSSSVTIDDNDNIHIPTGSNVTTTNSSLIFKELGGSNTVSLEAPNAVSPSYGIFVPSTTGTVDYTLRIADRVGSNLILAWEPYDAGLTGPSSSTHNAIARWDGTSGDTIQNSEITIDDSDNIAMPSGANFTFGNNAGAVFTETAGGGDTVTLKSAASVGINYSLVLPGTIPAVRSVLSISSKDTYGDNLSWSTKNAVDASRSTTNTSIARWNGTSGDAIQGSGILIDDADYSITVPNDVVPASNSTYDVGLTPNNFWLNLSTANLYGTFGSNSDYNYSTSSVQSIGTVTSVDVISGNIYPNIDAEYNIGSWGNRAGDWYTDYFHGGTGLPNSTYADYTNGTYTMFKRGPGSGVYNIDTGARTCAFANTETSSSNCDIYLLSMNDSTHECYLNFGSRTDATVFLWSFKPNSSLNQIIYAGANNQVLSTSGLEWRYIAGASTSRKLYYNTSTGEISYSSSSKRYKKDIKPLALDDILSPQELDELQVYSFTYKEDSKLCFGLIAEDVPEIFQLTAPYRKIKEEYKPEGKFDDEDPIVDSVNYHKVSMMTLVLAQDLYKENCQLEKEIEWLEKEVEKLVK